MVAANDVELEVLLGWVPEAKGFRITILYSAPGDQEYNRYFGRDPIRFDLETLNDDLQGETDVAEYGQLLGSMLFADAAQVPLDKAVAASQTVPVHLRIVVDPYAPPDYHAIRWETICQPSTGQPLTTRQNIRFSRFMAPLRGVQPTLLPRMGEMDALVAVPNPAGIANFASGSAELAPIAAEAELARARTALGHMNLRELPANGRRATRANIIEELSKGVHVLYLVCHGRIQDSRPQLLLEDEDGNTAVVDGTAFANDFGSMARIPTVVVLCSCESAGSGRVDEPVGAENDVTASDQRLRKPGGLPRWWRKLKHEHVNWGGNATRLCPRGDSGTETWHTCARQVFMWLTIARPAGVRDPGTMPLASANTAFDAENRAGQVRA